MKLVKIILALALYGAASSVSLGQDSSDQFLTAYHDALSHRNDDGARARFEALLPTVSVTLPVAQTYYVLEGDTLASDQEVHDYIDRKATEGVPSLEQPIELIVHTEDGVEAKWPDGAQFLKYAIDRTTFPDDASFQQVAADLLGASQDWVASCATCKIRFEHEPQFDSINTYEELQAATATDAIRFLVVYSGGPFDKRTPIASSFFPTDPWSRRILNIYPGYFRLTGGYTGRGVLRHEIGHILGYAHEQTRHIAGCKFEGDNWVPLTEYDPFSVMHYFCGGGGTRDLQLSALDVKGHNAFYGSTGP